MLTIREYKKASILTPLLVSMEVVMECTIPFIIAQLVNQINFFCTSLLSCFNFFYQRLKARAIE